VCFLKSTNTMPASTINCFALTLMVEHSRRVRHNDLLGSSVAHQLFIFIHSATVASYLLGCSF
jgi:hypothetical protein